MTQFTGKMSEGKGHAGYVILNGAKWSEESLAENSAVGEIPRSARNDSGLLYRTAARVSLAGIGYASIYPVRYIRRFDMALKTRVSKWGSGLAIRIPKAIAEEWGVKEGTQIEMTREGDGLRLCKPM